MKPPRPAVRGERSVVPAGDRPTWSTWREALAVVAYGPHLFKTIRVALIVGTVIFSINQFDVVLRHHATALTYVKSAITYLVPFCVSNYGILVATRRSPRTGR
jgi:hypothetical protein